MVCLPNVGVLGVGVLLAPLFLARGLGRRATHWFVINHQKHLQKLSIRRRHRRSHAQKRPCSEPLVIRPPRALDARVRPGSDPLPSTALTLSDSQPLYEVPVTRWIHNCGASKDAGHYASLPGAGVTGTKSSNGSEEVEVMPRPRPRTFFRKALYGNIFVRTLSFVTSGNATEKESPTEAPFLPDIQPGARDAGRRGTGGSQSPPHQLPPPMHGLSQGRPQNGAPQPPQLPTLPPPPIPKQTPKQFSRPSQPHGHPTNPQYLDHPPTEMAPAVPGYTGGSAGIGGHPKPGAERVPREDGGMVELTPLYRSIFDRPYFHIISRNKSREMLEKAEDGVFLIRPSTRSSDPLTLCLRYRSRTYNINIRCRPDGLFALGSEKTNEMTFSSIDDIVSTYTREPIKLQSGDRAMLTVPPPKSDHIYVKMPLPKVLGCQEVKMPM